MGKDSGLVFVSFDGTGQSDVAAARRAVRSRATAYSHRVKPRKGLKAARYKPLDHRTAKSQPLPTPQASPAPPLHENLVVMGDSIRPSIAPSLAPSNRDGVDSKSKRTSKDLTISKLLGYQPDPSPQVIFGPLLHYQAEKVIHAQKRKRSASPALGRKQHIKWESSPTINLRRLSASFKDPFDTYPVPWQPWYDNLLDNFYGRLQHPKAFKLLKCNQEDIVQYTNWARSFEMTEPALFYASLLLATGTPVSNGSLHINKALWLRGQAVKAINEALCDPVRSTSNALISAVGKIALHEHVYGDREAANKVHRAAQQRMIAIRGGVEALQLPRIVIHLMCWYDAYMAAESGTRAYFVDLPTRLKGVNAFSKQEAVRVTDLASPNRRMHPRFGVETTVTASPPSGMVSSEKSGEDGSARSTPSLTSCSSAGSDNSGQA